MNKLFTLSFAALIGALSHSALASETDDSHCPMHSIKHPQAASMPHAMKPMHHGAHDMHGKTCPTACKTEPSPASQTGEVRAPLNDAKHTH